MSGISHQNIQADLWFKSRSKKLLAVWDWIATGRQKYCAACRTIQKQTATQYDCALCPDRSPKLLPENREAWTLWILANTQWRVSGFSPIGLDYPAVFQIAEIYGIQVTPALFFKLKSLELQEINK